MTHRCCRPCRLRFTPAAAAHLGACPGCGEPLGASKLQGTVGFRLFRLKDVPSSLPYAVAGPSATVTDRHMRILRQVARQSQRELSGYDAVEHAGGVASTGRREYLERAATRTRARVADAEQRRNRRPNGHRDTQCPPCSACPPVYAPAGQPADVGTVSSAYRSAETPL